MQVPPLHPTFYVLVFVMKGSLWFSVSDGRGIHVSDFGKITRLRGVCLTQAGLADTPVVIGCSTYVYFVNRKGFFKNYNNAPCKQFQQ